MERVNIDPRLTTAERRIAELEAEVEQNQELLRYAHREITALEVEVERLRGACMSAIEAIRAGAEPWMLAELETQILTALEAENAALETRIAGLDRALAHVDRIAEKADADAEVERLRGALAVYADESNWSDEYVGQRWIGSDGTIAARTALEPTT